MRSRLVFVLEQTLGHAAHGRNLERALDSEPEVEPTVIRLPYERPAGIHRLPGLGSWSVVASMRARAALTRRLRQGPVDAIFIHTQVASLLATELMRVAPTVISLDATPENFDVEGRPYGHRRQLPPLERAKWEINRRAFGAATALVTWCRWAADSLVADYGIPPHKVQVVHPGVDLGIFRPGPRQSAAGPVRVLFVGGDFERKGGPDLLEAMRPLEGLAELDLVTGAEVADVPAGVTCRVHRGLRPQSPALLDLFRRADIFALPSRGDCFPQAIAEAMACGLPVVATRVGAMGEMVKDGVNGMLVPPRSPAALGHALMALAMDGRLRRRLGENSLAIARREHDAEANNRSIFRFMELLAQRRAAGRT